MAKHDSYPQKYYAEIRLAPSVRGCPRTACNPCSKDQTAVKRILPIVLAACRWAWVVTWA